MKFTDFLLVLFLLSIIGFIVGVIVLLWGIFKKNGKLKRNIVVVCSAISFTLLTFFSNMLIPRSPEVYSSDPAVNAELERINKKETVESLEPLSEEEVANNLARVQETIRKNEIQDAVEEIIKNDFDRTVLEKISINDNLGRDDGSYVVLVNLDYTGKLSKESTKELLEMYSGHLFASIIENYPVSSGSVFWQVPYFEANETLAKFSFEEEDGRTLVKEESFYGLFN